MSKTYATTRPSHARTPGNPHGCRRSRIVQEGRPRHRGHEPLEDLDQRLEDLYGTIPIIIAQKLHEGTKGEATRKVRPHRTCGTVTALHGWQTCATAPGEPCTASALYTSYGNFYATSCLDSFSLLLGIHKTIPIQTPNKIVSFKDNPRHVFHRWCRRSRAYGHRGGIAGVEQCLPEGRASRRGCRRGSPKA